jgi:DNA-binding HxlR family transcriptional regulator
MTTSRFAYDVYEDRCPTRLVLVRLADKWALLVLDRLETGPVRFNTLRRDIKRVTQKVLAQTLRKLERDGLISRRAFATVPMTVEYDLTPLGKTLTKTVSALAHWAEKNMDAVFAAQAAYDTATQVAEPQSGTKSLVRGGKAPTAKGSHVTKR